MNLKRTLIAGASLAVLAGVAHAETAPAVVNATTKYEDLSIALGQVPVAPAGKLLTLTVDGVEMPVQPGHYVGKVVLSVTDDIPVKYHDLPEHHFRAAALIKDGALDPARSVTAALAGRTRTAPGLIENAVITSRGDSFNGILVMGKGDVHIDHPVIDMVGNGGNDFAGFGAAIAVRDQAKVVIDRPVIRTKGAIRTALFVGGTSEVTVNDADIEVQNGTLPADYKFTVDVGRMMEVPWMLGLSGNVRATNLVDFGTVTYNRAHIRAQGWGAMSTDDNTRVRMFVNDSVIETIDSGYGCYSIGDSVDHFSRTVIRAADIGCIIAGEASVVFTDGTRVTSGRYGVMYHSGQGGGNLLVDKGSELHAAKTAIEVKGFGANVTVDDATVTSGSGVILQSMANDDPFMVAMANGQMPEGMTAPPPGAVGPAGAPPLPNAKTFGPDVVGLFRNTSLKGDFFNAREKDSAMVLTFEKASVVGRISSSTIVPASGKAPTRATLSEIGNVVNTPGFVPGGKGVSVTLGEGARWTVTGASYLSRLVIAPGAELDGGTRKLTVTVNGKPVKVKPGSYSGRILVSVS